MNSLMGEFDLKSLSFWVNGWWSLRKSIYLSYIIVSKSTFGTQNLDICPGKAFCQLEISYLGLDLKRLLPQMSTIDRDSVFQSNPQLYKIPCGHFYSVAAMNNQFTAKVWKRSMFVTRLHPFQMFMEPPYKAPTAPYQDECSCFAFIWFSVDFCFFPRLIEGKSGVRPDFFDCSTESSFILSGQRSQVHLCTWKKYEFVLAIALVKLFQEQIKMDIFLIETWNKEHGQGGGKAGKWNKENKVMQSVLNSK